jgi:hypothetical protein
MSKKFPGRDSAQVLFNWLKGIYLAPPRNGQVINESRMMTTLDGQKVKILEIYTPQWLNPADSIMQAPKMACWSYVDTGEYQIAFNLSSTEPEKYKRAMPLFQYMVQSFKEE